MIDKIVFQGYKSFKNSFELELKPITVIFGKNSSGKSAIAKLPTLIEASLSGKFNEPFHYINNGVSLGAEYRDLFYNRGIQEQMKFELHSSSKKLTIQITSSDFKPLITEWSVEGSEFGNKQQTIQFDQIEKMVDSQFAGFMLKKEIEWLRSSFYLPTDYVGPFRLEPPRVFHLENLMANQRLGKKGEHAYQILVQNPELVEKVNAWYEKNFDGWGLTINKVEPYYEIRIVRSGGSKGGVNIVDVGQGLSQALPIVTKALLKNDFENLSVFEQPELHLHPAAHGNLAELLAMSTLDSKNSYLIETHSKNFILRLRTLIAKGVIRNSSVNLYYVSYNETDNCSELRQIKLSEKGEVDFWPDNVFDESYQEVKELLKAQENKKTK